MFDSVDITPLPEGSDRSSALLAAKIPALYSPDYA